MANEVEAEEDYLVNTLQRRLNQLSNEKSQIESKLEMEQGEPGGGRGGLLGCVVVAVGAVILQEIPWA